MVPWGGIPGARGSSRSGWVARGRSATRAPVVSRVRVRVRARARVRARVRVRVRVRVRLHVVGLSILVVF